MCLPTSHILVPNKKLITQKCMRIYHSSDGTLNFQFKSGNVCMMFTILSISVWLQNASQEAASNFSITSQKIQVHGAVTSIYQIILQSCVPIRVKTYEYGKIVNNNTKLSKSSSIRSLFLLHCHEQYTIKTQNCNL